MKTDHPIYLFLSAGPETFRVLTGGHQLEGTYRLCSLTIKGINRRLDGILEPEGTPGRSTWSNSKSSPPTRLGTICSPRSGYTAIGDVLEFWFFERFRGLTAKEIWARLNLATPIQETRAYQSIFAEGKAEGEATAKASTLKRRLTRRFGPVPAWAERRIDAAPVAQLDAWLDGIFDAARLEDLIGDDGDEC